ncbi:MAG: hypothetical protein KC442_23230 [Thermomicrobiales bacterium]|nr:hypothetical protein [Thermomicrobiales bacterium]
MSEQEWCVKYGMAWDAANDRCLTAAAPVMTMEQLTEAVRNLLHGTNTLDQRVTALEVEVGKELARHADRLTTRMVKDVDALVTRRLEAVERDLLLIAAGEVSSPADLDDDDDDDDYYPEW